MSRIGALRFTLLNVMGAGLWTLTYAIAGYGVGALWERIAGTTPWRWVAAIASLILLSLTLRQVTRWRRQSE